MTSTLIIRVCLLSVLVCGAGACAPAPHASAATDQVPDAQAAPAPAGVEEGRTSTATFIADRLHGRKTASGEPYDRHTLVAAHSTYPLGTLVRVTNQANGRAVDVKVVDRTARRNRGPQMIDVSRAAAERLGFIEQGTTKVTLEVIARPSR